MIVRNGYSRTFRNHPLLARLVFGSYISRYWVASTGAGQYFQINPYFYIRTRDGIQFVAWTPEAYWDRLKEPWTFVPEVVIPAGLHRMDVYNAIYQSGRSKNYWYVVDIKAGGFYGGRQVGLAPELNYILNRHARLSLSASYNRFLFPRDYYQDGSRDVVTRTVLYGRLDITVSPQLSLKTFIQYQSDDRLVTSNIRLRYNPSEGRDLYLVFNLGLPTERSSWVPVPPPVMQKALILKYSHIFIY